MDNYNDWGFGSYNDYSYLALKQNKRDVLKKEYRKLRREAKRRIREIEKSGLDEEDKYITKNKEYLALDPSKMRKEELAKYLAYTASFLHSDLSTLAGQERRRSRTIETLQSMGYDVTEENFPKYAKFWRRIKPAIKGKIIGSPDAMKMYERARELNISVVNVAANIEDYVKNYDAIMGEDSDLKLNPNRSKPYTYKELERMLNKRKGKKKCACQSIK